MKFVSGRATNSSEKYGWSFERGRVVEEARARRIGLVGLRGGAGVGGWRLVVRWVLLRDRGVGMPL